MCPSFSLVSLAPRADLIRWKCYNTQQISEGERFVACGEMDPSRFVVCIQGVRVSAQHKWLRVACISLRQNMMLQCGWLCLGSSMSTLTIDRIIHPSTDRWRRNVLFQDYHFLVLPARHVHSGRMCHELPEVEHHSTTRRSRHPACCYFRRHYKLCTSLAANEHCSLLATHHRSIKRRIVLLLGAL